MLIIVMLVLVDCDSLISFKSGQLIGLALETCIRRSCEEEKVEGRTELEGYSHLFEEGLSNNRVQVFTKSVAHLLGTFRRDEIYETDVNDSGFVTREWYSLFSKLQMQSQAWKTRQGQSHWWLCPLTKRTHTRRSIITRDLESESRSASFPVIYRGVLYSLQDS